MQKQLRSNFIAQSCIDPVTTFIYFIVTDVEMQRINGPQDREERNIVRQSTTSHPSFIRRMTTTLREKLSDWCNRYKVLLFAFWNVFWCYVLVLLFWLYVEEFLKDTCTGTGKDDDFIYDPTGSGCVIKREPKCNQMFHCHRADGVTGTCRIKALFPTQIEMTLSDNLPHAVAFSSEDYFLGWLHIDSGVECIMRPLNDSPGDVRMLMDPRIPKCEFTKHNDHMSFTIPDSSQPPCVIVPYNLIDSPVTLSLPKADTERHRNCTEKLVMVGNVKTQGPRALIGFNVNSCRLPTMAKGS